jgi:DNA-binding CsgD family transcriptional regulator
VHDVGLVERSIASLLGEASEILDTTDLPAMIRRHLEVVLPSDEIYFAPFGPRYFAETAPFYRAYAQRLPAFERDLTRARAVMAREGGFVDVEVYSERERRNLPAFAELVRPERISSMLMAPVHCNGVASGTVTLLRKGRASRFTHDLLLRAIPLLRAVGFVHRAFIPTDARRISRAPSAAPPARPALAALTEAETEVAALVAEGYPNLRIAATLGKSVHTVRRQLESIYRRLRLGNRTELSALVHSLRSRHDERGRLGDAETSDLRSLLGRLPSWLESGICS